MSEQLSQMILSEVLKRLNQEGVSVSQSEKAPAVKGVELGSGFPEFVGTAMGDTVGLVIPSVDPIILEQIEVKKYKAIGVIGARTGAGPQLMAADEAVKASNSEVVLFELPRDTKGQGGHGCLILFGAEDVSDARRAVEITLKSLGYTFGDIYVNEAGFMELQYSARASHALHTYMNAPLGKAFGLIVGCPAAVGVLMADVAVKAASVDVVMHASPAKVTSHSNEFMIMISGDAGAVKQSVIAGREMGRKILSKMGDPPQSLQVPYIL